MTRKRADPNKSYFSRSWNNSQEEEDWLEIMLDESGYAGRDESAFDEPIPDDSDVETEYINIALLKLDGLIKKHSHGKSPRKFGPHIAPHFFPVTSCIELCQFSEIHNVKVYVDVFNDLDIQILVDECCVERHQYSSLEDMSYRITDIDWIERAELLAKHE